MKKCLNATDQSGQDILVDPNDVKLNAAGTNMAVSCRPDNNLNRGDQRPEYVNFHHLKFEPSDKEEMDRLFKELVAEKAAKIRAEKLAIRRAKKNNARKTA